jgi:hypothetical protein
MSYPVPLVPATVVVLGCAPLPNAPTVKAEGLSIPAAVFSKLTVPVMFCSASA